MRTSWFFEFGSCNIISFFYVFFLISPTVVARFMLHYFYSNLVLKLVLSSTLLFWLETEVSPASVTILKVDLTEILFTNFIFSSK